MDQSDPTHPARDDAGHDATTEPSGGPAVQEPDPLFEPQVRVATFDRYIDAQAAVDHLGDAGHDIGGIAILWSGLRQVEYVTGRRTVASAARDGALAGAWLGLVFSLLLALFVEFDDGTSALTVIVTWVVVSAAVGGGWAAALHWQQRGTRDFASTTRVEAERYELWVSASEAAVVRSMLAVPGR